MYKLESVLGKGTYTKVFASVKGEHSVAVKKILINKKEGIEPWMLRELEIMRYIHHPNVCKANRIEYIKGPTPHILIEMDRYESSLDKTTIPTELILSVVKDIATGLGYLHANNIAHRDLKPGNIMLTKDNRAVIIDFNLSKVVLNSTHTPDICTMIYSSPEMLESKNCDPLIHDVWSFGTIVLELISNSGHPFNKDRQLRVIQKQKSFLLEKSHNRDYVRNLVKDPFKTEEFKQLIDVVNLALVSRKTRPKIGPILKALGISSKFEGIDEPEIPHIPSSLLKKISKLINAFFEEYDMSGADYAISLFCRFMKKKKGLDTALVAAAACSLIMKSIHNTDMYLENEDNPLPFEIFGVNTENVKKFEIDILVDVNYRIMI